MSSTKDRDILHRSWLLPIIVGVAVLLHIAFFFTVHEMQLAFSGSSHSLKYDESRSRSNQSEINQPDRDHQLAQLFKQMTTRPSGEPATVTPLSHSKIEVIPPTLSQLPVEWEAVALDFSAIPRDQQQNDLDHSLAVDILLPTSMPAVDDFLQATEAILGDVDLRIAERYNPDNARGGQQKFASIQGNAFDNRSGFDHDAILDLDHTSNARLSGALTTFDQELRDLAKQEEKGLTQQLGQQRVVISTEAQLSHGSEGNAKIASGSDFFATVEYAPRREGGGFYFRVILTPKPDVSFKTITHNVSFLIDRSQSIDKKRYAATKVAVMEALHLLRQGDSFNVFVFDDKVVSFAPANVLVTSDSVAMAQQFLVDQAHGTPFSSTDLYASLGNVVPDVVSWQELNTAILLSDGVTYKSRDLQRRHIADWTAHNDGKVDLYSIAIGKDNNLPLLDLLVSLNRGSLSFCPSCDGVSDAMVGLMKTLRHPIGKDMEGSVIPLRDGVIAELYPKEGRLQSLYRDVPYILYGWISHPDDFYVFLQGRYYDRSLDIKQRISLREGKEISADLLERQMAILQAYDLYDRYLSLIHI